MDDTTRPNVLLICCDHLSDLDLRPAGNPTVMTPTFEQIARNGVRFSRCYTAHPVCGPARRSLLTGTTARTHGDRRFANTPLPAGLTTIAQAFRNAGYQAYAVGKMHLEPQRGRFGFDDIILNEEGRMKRGPGGLDDYEIYVAERGFAGQEFATGMCSNDYMVRPWQLPEDCHPTNWTAREACKMIQRRDPTRPAFWYVSFTTPHPPLYPLREYLDLYRDVPIPEAVVGEWAKDPSKLPFHLRGQMSRYAISGAPRHEFELALRGFYALVTHIDHQVRLIIGTLREQGLLGNTIIALTADHGDMLGQHNMWAKGVFHERSARVPLIISCPSNETRVPPDTTDDRLAELRDVMPTLLDLAGVPIPKSVEGQSLMSSERREHLFGEVWEHAACSRMVRDERFKLIYYPAGNRFQLFDLVNDPQELVDLSASAAHAGDLDRLRAIMVEHMHGTDVNWFEGADKSGRLVGMPEPTANPRVAYGLHNQRGIRFV